MKKYKLNYLIMLTMFVFTVSSSVGEVEKKLETITKNEERTLSDLVSQMASARVEPVQVLRDASTKINEESKKSINRAIDKVQLEIQQILKDAGLEVNEGNTSLEKVLAEYRNIEKDIGKLLMKLALAKGLFEAEKAFREISVRTLNNIITDIGNKVVKEVLREAGFQVNKEHDAVINMQLVNQRSHFLNILKDAGIETEIEEEINNILIKMTSANFEFYKALRDVNVKANAKKVTLIKLAVANEQLNILNILKDAGGYIDIESEILNHMILGDLTFYMVGIWLDSQMPQDAAKVLSVHIILSFLEVNVKGVKIGGERAILHKIYNIYLNIIEALKEIGVKKWDEESDAFKLEDISLEGFVKSNVESDTFKVDMLKDEEYLEFVKALSEASATTESEASANARSHECNKIFNN